MKYYFPEDINISLVAESSTAVINKQVTTSFSDHKNNFCNLINDQKILQINYFLISEEVQPHPLIQKVILFFME